MHFSNLISVYVLNLACAFWCTGCCVLSPNTPENELGDPRTDVEGVWVGRIEPIKLYGESESDIFPALTLHISDGPRLQEPIGPELGGGSVPILTRYKNSLFRILSPDDLPAGRLVKVRGRMLVFYTFNDPTPEQKRGDINLNRRPSPIGSRRYGEHIIVVKGRPKLLKE
jgi:hypothetical protein